MPKTFTYLPGDILFKLDLRGCGYGTREHMMLVAGEDNGYPIVFHMIINHSTDLTGTLVKETLLHGRELFLLRLNLAPELQHAIMQAAEQALQSKQFFINAKIIQAQKDEAALYTSITYETVRKFEKLKHLFSQQTPAFTPTPDEIKLVSCHEWVLEIMHYAFRQTAIPIPSVLQIPPALAWASNIFSAVALAQNKDVSLHDNISVQTIAYRYQEKHAPGQTPTIAAPTKPAPITYFFKQPLTLSETILSICKNLI